MILKVSVNGNIQSELELDYTTMSWSIPAASNKWGGVMYSSRGLFELKSWGAMWLMDGVGFLRNSTVILHDAPVSEEDRQHAKGSGLAYAPAQSSLKDAKVDWEFVRPSGAVSTAGASTGLTPIRLKVKAICELLLPPQGRLTNGQPPHPGATGSGCGEFPGRVMRRLPVAEPPAKGAFSIMAQGNLLNLCGPTTHWENMIKAIDEKYKPARRVWVDFAGSNRPRTGDIYILCSDSGLSTFQHVGVIISAEGNEWLTADGGQGGNKFCSGLIKRKFGAGGQMDGEFGNTAWIKGWADLDNLAAALPEYFPKEFRPVGN